jgi:glycosyltransferase involved in cell wall biosynthesis
MPAFLFAGRLKKFFKAWSLSLMTRSELIRRPFSRSDSVIEIGASYNPVIPKNEGWNATVIDHTTKEDLIKKYGEMGVTTLDSIENVDYIWNDGPLAAIVPKELHSSFDGLVASHVGEHFPDLIGFFQNASKLLKKEGVIALALPDKRVCFDFFQPLTTSGDLIDAHLKGRTRHQKKTFFNQTAYSVVRDNIAWMHSGNTSPFKLANPLSLAKEAYDNGDESPSSSYQDCHAWAFTPKSFELLILELNVLGFIDWSIKLLVPAAGIEFYVWLERSKIALTDAEVSSRRLALLKDTVFEVRDAIDQLDEADNIKVTPHIEPRVASAIEMQRPNIVAVIPLYNGSKYIEQAIHSVFAQTLMPKEVIVVNDGSTDNDACVDIVKNLSKQYPITLINKSNGGQSSARNLAVRESTSEYIAFLDQDDIWYPNHLEKLYQPFIEAHNPKLGWVYSDLDEIDDNDNVIHRNYLSSLSTNHPKTNIFQCIQEDMFILPSASLISREAFEDVGGFDEIFCGYEDDDLFLRLFRKGYKNVFLSDSLSKWRIYPLSTSYSYRMVESRHAYTRKLISTFPDDEKRSRYYIRDLIVPRFFGNANYDYKHALKTGEIDLIAETWKEVEFLASYNDHIFKQVSKQLFVNLLMKYKTALQKGNDKEIAEIWKELTVVVTKLPANQKKLALTLQALRNPKVAKSAFAARKLMRPAMTYAFSIE